MNWTTRISATGANLRAVTWAGDRFVAVGEWGTILSSRDGIKWVKESTGSSLVNIIWGGDRWVASGGGQVLTSPDKDHWAYAFEQWGSVSVSDVARSPTTFVFANGGFRTSTDLIGVTDVGQTNGAGCFNVIWTGTQFAAACTDGKAWMSPDGMQWTSVLITSSTDQWRDLAWSGSLFVALAGNGTVATSPDGAAWTPHATGIPGLAAAIATSGERFVAVGENGHIATSTDAINWTVVALNGTILTNVAWVGDRFVAVGSQGFAIQSTDGTYWRDLFVPAEVSQSINGVGVGPGGSLIGVGENELILDLTGSLAN